MIYIYDNKGNFVESLNYEKNEFKTEWYTKWKNGYIISETKFINPIIEKGKIREKTREELILLDNKLELLQDGEYVEAGKIVVVETPEGFIKRIWDKNMHIWKEGTTREELLEERKNKILEHKKLKDNKKDLEESEFSSKEEILMLSEKMALLEANISNLAEKIKGL